ncbi:MAG TPA: hypothetical protein VGG74_37415 [Kofleriaceae bacterium]
MRGMASICAVVMLASIACAPQRRGAVGDDDDSGGTDANGTGGSNGSNSNCGSGAEFVYTIDEFTNQLSRFDPMTKTFTDLGALSCNQGTATPFSMGVDRNTVAWVLYDSGTLYHVDINNGLACTPTTWASSMGLTVFGMGFSTDTVGGQTDSLFVGGGAQQEESSYSLAKINTATMTAQIVGSEPDLPEMTGNSNAELWGFIPADTSARVVQFDKTNGSVITSFDEPTLAGTTNGYAFAHWGGDYWVFISTQAMTTVYQVDHTSGAITSTTPAPGRTVVGAGVSTCAPTVIQ